MFFVVIVIKVWKISIEVIFVNSPSLLTSFAISSFLRKSLSLACLLFAF